MMRLYKHKNIQAVAGFTAFLLAFLAGSAAFASEGSSALVRGGHPLGLVAIGVFVVAYLLVMLEDVTGLRKSKPVLMGAAIIWALVALATSGGTGSAGGAGGHTGGAAQAFRAVFLEFAELLLFLLVAMTYVNVLTERGVFNALRVWLIRKNLGFRAVFWITGGLAFLLSPWIDNLTTALVVGSVAVAVGRDHPRFVTICCVSIVTAANASGAFSPFGDVTTLMVWQKGVLPFGDFFHLFVPSLVNWLVPAVIMGAFLPKGDPFETDEVARMKPGARRVVVLFALTIALTVSAHQYLAMPPVYGMMAGLGLLKLFGFFLNRLETRDPAVESAMPFNIFHHISEVEWDTLLFFYGVIVGVGGLAAFGYLDALAQHLYGAFSPTTANVGIGLLSAVVDNIPVMYAVLAMHPAMDQGQWLLVTLTAGVGGSLLSIGSAAGVALMGASGGRYTFTGHLKWSWAVALGYALSIAAHLAISGHLFDGLALARP